MQFFPCGRTPFCDHSLYILYGLEICFSLALARIRVFFPACSWSFVAARFQGRSADSARCSPRSFFRLSWIMSFSWDFTFVHCSFSSTDSFKSVAREDRAILLNRRMGSFCLRADLRSSVVARHFRLLAGCLSPLSSCDNPFCHMGLCQRGLSPEGSSAFSILFWRPFRRQFAVGSSM